MGSKHTTGKRREPGRSDTAQSPRQLVPAQHERRLHLAVMVIGFLACGITSLVLGQDNNWDLRNYHYYNPYALLTDRVGEDIAPAQRQSYLNPISDLPYYFGTTYLNARVYGFLLGGVQGLTLWLIFAICFASLRHLAGNERLGLSLVCSILGVYAPVFVGEIGTTLNDSLLGMLILLSLYLFMRVIVTNGTMATPGSRRTLLIGAAVFGAAVGLKLTLLLYAIGAAIGLMFIERNWRDRAVVLGIWSAAFLGGFLISAGLWSLKLWQEYQNPLFPFYNDIFKSPWAQVKSFSDTSMLPENIWQYFTHPFIYIIKSHYRDAQHGFRDARYAVVFVLFAALALKWLTQKLIPRARTAKTETSSPETRFVLAFFVTSYVLWQAKFTIIRYTASLESIAPLVVVLIAGYLVQKTELRKVIVAFSFLPIVLLMKPIDHPRIPWQSTFWDVQVPELEDPQNTLIFQANPRPWSYLWPMFPREVRFINVKSNLMYPDHDTKLNDTIKALIASHNGDMFLITRSAPAGWLEHDGPVMEGYGLRVITDEAKPITSRHSLPRLTLYRLVRTEEKMKQE